MPYFCKYFMDGKYFFFLIKLLNERTKKVKREAVPVFRPCLGLRPRRLNAKCGNNPAKQVASDARLRNAPEAKSGSFNCARKNRRSDVPAALAFTRRASGARGPKQGLS